MSFSRWHTLRAPSTEKAVGPYVLVTGAMVGTGCCDCSFIVVDDRATVGGWVTRGARYALAIVASWSGVSPSGPAPPEPVSDGDPIEILGREVLDREQGERRG